MTNRSYDTIVFVTFPSSFVKLKQIQCEEITKWFNGKINLNKIGNYMKRIIMSTYCNTAVIVGTVIENDRAKTKATMTKNIGLNMHELSSH